MKNDIYPGAGLRISLEGLWLLAGCAVATIAVAGYVRSKMNKENYVFCEIILNY